MKLPQLSLRELFLLVVIAAMGCGWWVDRDSLRRQLLAQDYNVKLLTLINSKASDVAGSVRGIYPDDNMEISSDSRTNTVMIRGSQTTLDVVERIILRLDEPEESHENDAASQADASASSAPSAMSPGRSAFSPGATSILAPDPSPEKFTPYSPP
jgi:type II/III secretion system protein